MEPYTPSRATALFTAYADEEDSTTIGPEGFERLCNDADTPLEGAKPLILAWLLRAAEMAKISKTEWEAGMAELQCVSSCENIGCSLTLSLQDRQHCRALDSFERL